MHEKKRHFILKEKLQWLLVLVSLDSNSWQLAIFD